MGYDFTAGESKALAITAIVGAIISICSGLILIYLLLSHRKYIFSYWRLILGLALVDMFVDLCFFAGPLLDLLGYDRSTYCTTQGFLLQTGTGASIIYNVMTCIHIFLIVVKKRTTIPTRIEILFHAIPYVFSITVSVLPLFHFILPGVKYGPAGPWCWIEGEPKYARFAMLYGWLWVITVFILALYFVAWLRTRKERVRYMCMAFAQPTEVKKLQDMERRLWLFPLMGVAIWLPATVSRVAEAFGKYWFFLLFTEASVLPLLGAVDLFIFLFTSGIILNRDAEIFNNQSERLALSVQS